MCGRYALGISLSEIQTQLEEAGFALRQTLDEPLRGSKSYNIAPGCMEPVLRAVAEVDETRTEKDIKYYIQIMRWGLVPSWANRSMQYRPIPHIINCRDDALATNNNTWNSIKQNQRCVVIAHGFFEWVNKGNQKLPYYVKRKDGALMMLAGLWDRVVSQDSSDNAYTYTIITTSSNTQLSFVHDRMPVIMETFQTVAWLNPTVQNWRPELQNILRPFDGELEIYRVTQDVGKAGNNNSTFILPLDQNNYTIQSYFTANRSCTEQQEHIPFLGSKRKYQSEIDTLDPKDIGATDINVDMTRPTKNVKKRHSQPSISKHPQKSTSRSNFPQTKNKPADPGGRNQKISVFFKNEGFDK
ncbi:hypothetical protein EDC01DRAFT_626623 [Geopyxis carbonaria]|nr:hypothetical protein EDC01DRAFT_626623 [Geopyxis carbonaria]